MAFDILSFLIGLAGGGLLTALILFPRLTAAKERLRQKEEETAKMGDTFSLLAQDVLQKSTEQFLVLAKEKLQQAQADGKHDLEKRQKEFTNVVDPIKKNLEELGSAVEQIKGTDKALREDLNKLNRETARLVGALKDPAQQGRWGEFILEGLLEKSGLIKGVHYETQVTIEGESRMRPDAVINMNDGFHIVIDAKAPVNKFAEQISETTTEDELTALTTKLARQVREHVKALGRKGYWENLDSPDFTVMFLPSEHMFSMALRADPGLVDYAASKNVIIASPTLIMSLLRVVALSWRQAELAKNAQDISARGAELYQRLSTFAGHFEKVGRGIDSAMSNYNNAIGSLERSVLPAARDLEKLHVETAGKTVDAPEQLATAQREITADELKDSSAPGQIEDKSETEAA